MNSDNTRCEALVLILLAAWACSSAVAEEQAIHLSPVAQVYLDAGATMVAAGPRGEVYALGIDKEVGGPNFERTFVRRSIDFGRTFEPARFFTDGGASEFSHRVVTDSRGGVYVSWNRLQPPPDAAGLFCNCSHDAGATWLESDVKVSVDDARGVGSHRLTFAERDLVHVVWIDSGPDQPRHGIWHRRSLDGGITFEPKVTPLWFEEYYSDLVYVRAVCADGDGSVYALLSRETPGDPDDNELYVQTSLDDGVTWLGPVLVDPISESLGCAALQCDADGNVFVAWCGNRNGFGDVFFTCSQDQGRTFEATRRLNADDPPGQFPGSGKVTLAGDEEGNLYAAWQRGNDVRVNVSRDRGATWAGDVSLGPTVAWDLPKLVANEAGHVAVTWVARTTGEFAIELNVSRDFGTTWLPTPLRIDDPNGLAYRQELVMDPAGRVYVAWEEEFPEGMGLRAEATFRAAYPTLGISLVPVDDADGLIIVPPGGERIAVDVDLVNHHPTAPLPGLTAYLEGGLPDGRIIGPLGDPKTFGIPLGGARGATLRKRFPGNKPPGLYYLIVTTEGAIEDSVRLPIIKR